MTDIDKLEALRSKAERGFGRELHEAYKNELFIAAPALFAEVRRLREQLHCRKCGGTVGVHLAPDQGGCPAQFVLDGVEMLPAAARQDVDDLRSEVRRLRAIEAAARNLDDEHAEPDGLWVAVPILAKHWDELRAALAAKEGGK